MKHLIRTAKGTAKVNLTPKTAIRRKCFDCCCWNAAEVRKCAARLCPLWPFRLGFRAAGGNGDDKGTV